MVVIQFNPQKITNVGQLGRTDTPLLPRQPHCAKVLFFRGLDTVCSAARIQDLLIEEGVVSRNELGPKKKRLDLLPDLGKIGRRRDVWPGYAVDMGKPEVRCRRSDKVTLLVDNFSVRYSGQADGASAVAGAICSFEVDSQKISQIR